MISPSYRRCTNTTKSDTANLKIVTPIALWKRQMLLVGLGRYSQYRYSIDTDINRYVSIRSSCCTDTDDGGSCKKKHEYFGPKTIGFTLDFHTIYQKKIKHIEFDLNYVELLICGKSRSLCFSTSIFRIHIIDQSKTFTVLLKSNILDFEP